MKLMYTLAMENQEHQPVESSDQLDNHYTKHFRWLLIVIPTLILLVVALGRGSFQQKPILPETVSAKVDIEKTLDDGSTVKLKGTAKVGMGVFAEASGPAEPKYFSFFVRPIQQDKVLVIKTKQNLVCVTLILENAQKLADTNNLKKEAESRGGYSITKDGSPKNEGGFTSQENSTKDLESVTNCANPKSTFDLDGKTKTLMTTQELRGFDVENDKGKGELVRLSAVILAGQPLKAIGDVIVLAANSNKK